MVTVLTQSSSASIAIALTAASGGFIALEPAAALIIGANLGSTSTGLFAVIGATPAAKRVAMSHLLFNLLTGVVALALLPVFIAVVAAIGRTATLPDDPAIFLALFHSVFNVVGVLLMWPIAAPMIKWLSRRFITAEEDEARLHYLDKTTAAVPVLAAGGVVLELERLAGLAGGLLATTVSGDHTLAPFVKRRAMIVKTLAHRISRFLGGLYSRELPADLATSLVNSARALHHYIEAAEITRYLIKEMPDHDTLPESLREETHQYLRLIATTARSAGRLDRDPDTHRQDLDTEAEIPRIKEAYASLKESLLDASASGDISLDILDSTLRTVWHSRRAAVQMLKAHRRLERLRDAVNNVRSDEPEEDDNGDMSESDAGDELNGEGEDGESEPPPFSNAPLPS